MRNVMRSGLSDTYIENLLSQVPRPFNFNPLAVAYNFSIGWVEVVIPDSNDIINNNFESWLDELVDEGDIDKLEDMVDLMENFINRVKQKDAEANI